MCSKTAIRASNALCKCRLCDRSCKSEESDRELEDHDNRGSLEYVLTRGVRYVDPTAHLLYLLGPSAQCSSSTLYPRVLIRSRVFITSAASQEQQLSHSRKNLLNKDFIKSTSPGSRDTECIAKTSTATDASHERANFTEE